MKRIKIYFVDFWKGFKIEENYFIRILSKSYEVVIDQNPDYLFYSTFGFEHLKYKDCVKIYFTGENDVPDFNFCDYAIGFQHITFEDRYIRYPLYLLYKGYDSLSEKKVDRGLLNRKFCNFVYSNTVYSTPLREQFYHQLSKYKKIDSGGRFLNNVGGAVRDKIEFIKDYKFTIAFENSSLSGYTTEKLMEPMTINSLPIYWGNPNVGMDFNKDSFLCIQDFDSVEMAIDEIIRLDKDEDAYMEKISIPWVTEQQTEKKWKEEFDLFLQNIFSQDIGKAKRTTMFGYAVIKKYREARFAKLASWPLLRNM